MIDSPLGSNSPDKKETAPKKRILIIDDDEVHIEIAAEMLRDEQFDVFAHHDGRSVIERVKELHPDLVLLDIHMPGVSGDGLAELFRAEPSISHIPLIFYSSYDEESLKKLVSIAGVQGYICKWNIGELQAKIKQYLHMPSSDNA